jgi:hypothetical protein
LIFKASHGVSFEVQTQFAVWQFSRTISAFRIAPPLPLKKIPVNPHRLNAARVIRLGAVIKKEPGQPNSQTL